MTTASTPRLGLPPGTSYRLLLPPQWVRLPVNSVGMRAAARRHLEVRFADLPRDRTLALRRQLEDELVGLAETVSGQFAVDILLLSTDLAGVPVSASGLVSLVPIPLSDETHLQRLRETTAEGADTSGVVDLGSNRVVRVLRHAEPTSADGEPVAATAEVARTVLGPDDGSATPLTGRSRLLDYYVPVPDSDAVMLLSFSTAVPALFEPLTGLFDAIASTLQWQQEGTPWR